jgi:hypothetical protein
LFSRRPLNVPQTAKKNASKFHAIKMSNIFQPKPENKKGRARKTDPAAIAFPSSSPRISSSTQLPASTAPLSIPPRTKSLFSDTPPSSFERRATGFDLPVSSLEPSTSKNFHGPVRMRSLDHLHSRLGLHLRQNRLLVRTVVQKAGSDMDGVDRFAHGSHPTLQLNKAQNRRSPRTSPNTATFIFMLLPFRLSTKRPPNSNESMLITTNFFQSSSEILPPPPSPRSPAVHLPPPFVLRPHPFPNVELRRLKLRKSPIFHEKTNF